MVEADLLIICGTAFLAVFVILVILAIVIRLICMAFPLRGDSDDAALVAAIGTAAATIYPGARVTRIKEET